jgi:hypothetical protein
MLGDGEQLRKLTITVEQLLCCSAKDARERDGVLPKGLGYSHHGSVYLPKGWGRCIPLFIHFGHCRTVEV